MLYITWAGRKHNKITGVIIHIDRDYIKTKKIFVYDPDRKFFKISKPLWRFESFLVWRKKLFNLEYNTISQVTIEDNYPEILNEIEMHFAIQKLKYV